MHQPCFCLLPFTGHIRMEKEVNCTGTFSGMSFLDGWCMFPMFVTVSVSHIRRIANETIFVTISEVELYCVASVQCVYDSSGSWSTSDFPTLAILGGHLGRAEGLVIGPYAEEKAVLLLTEKFLCNLFGTRNLWFPKPSLKNFSLYFLSLSRKYFNCILVSKK